jgi:FdrA protein
MKTETSPLQQPMSVINIGLESFAEDLRKIDVPVIQMDWRPPAGGDMRLVALLDSLEDEA